MQGIRQMKQHLDNLHRSETKLLKRVHQHMKKLADVYRLENEPNYDRVFLDVDEQYRHNLAGTDNLILNPSSSGSSSITLPSVVPTEEPTKEKQNEEDIAELSDRIEEVIRQCPLTEEHKIPTDKIYITCLYQVMALYSLLYDVVKHNPDDYKKEIEIYHQIENTKQLAIKHAEEWKQKIMSEEIDVKTLTAWDLYSIIMVSNEKFDDQRLSKLYTAISGIRQFIQPTEYHSLEPYFFALIKYLEKKGKAKVINNIKAIQKARCFPKHGFESRSIEQHICLHVFRVVNAFLRKYEPEQPTWYQKLIDFIPDSWVS